MNSTADARVALSLRATPKGGLHYDRGSPPPVSASWSARSPPESSSHCQSSDWTCVLEEVTSEMDREKCQTLARLTRDWNRILALKQRNDELEEVALPVLPPTSPVDEIKPEKPAIRRASPVNRLSPVDQRLKRAELARQADRSRVVMANRLRVTQVQAALAQASRDQYEAQSQSRMADLARKTEERLKLEAREKAEREIEAQKLALERQRAEEERRRAQAEIQAEAERAQAAFQSFRSECQKWVELILRAEKAYQATAAEVQRKSAGLSRFLAQRKQDLPNLKQFLQTGTLPSSEVLSQARESHQKLEQLLRELSAAHQAHNKALAAQQEREKQAQIEAEAKTKASEVIITPAPVIEPTVIQASSEISTNNRAKLDALTAFKADWVNNLRAFMSDPAQKSFRFSCQKAVNTPVNAINANSSSHLRQKLDHLQALLRGQGLEVTGQPFNASTHPMGVPFCKYILAKKLVDQGSDVISAKPDAAFGVAQVIVALWAEFADFGQLILATFYEVCPYLVPFHKHKTPDEDSVAYYQSVGYQLTNEGSLEKQDLYVKRMSGIGRLYAAITSSALPKDQLGKIDHPHGIGHAWCWLSSEMNLSPINDVTATLIQVVLEVSGHKLAEIYGKMFIKVVVTLCRRYLPLIKKATIEGSGGPVDRLETTLSKIMSSGQVDKPHGLLSVGFI